MNSKKFLLGLLSSLFLAIGFVRAAEALDSAVSPQANERVLHQASALPTEPCDTAMSNWADGAR